MTISYIDTCHCCKCAQMMKVYKLINTNIVIHFHVTQSRNISGYRRSGLRIGLGFVIA